MNNSSLPIVDSKVNLSSRFFDYSNVYFLPITCSFGLLTSILCLLASYKKDASNANLMTYIFINSTIDFLFVLTQLFSFIIRCGILCPYGYAYLSKQYEIYIFWFVGYSLINMQVFFNTFVAYNRLKAFSSKSIQQTSNFYRPLILFALIAIVLNTISYPLDYDAKAFAIYMPNPYTTELLYQSSFRDEFQTTALQDIIFVCLALKDPFMYLFFCFLNLLVVLRYRKYVKNRRYLVKNTRSSKYIFFLYNIMDIILIHLFNSSDLKMKEKNESNFTRLTLNCCVLYVFGNLIDCFIILASIFNFQYFYFCDGCVDIIGNFFFYISYSMHFFIYYKYNNKFKAQFISFCKEKLYLFR